MNPYASYLKNQDPVAVIAATPSKLAQLIDMLGEKGLERPWAPGKWTARQILCHLADCEIVFAFRIRQALAEPHHVIQPFDQDRYAEQYSAVDARTAFQVYRTVRNWNVELIKSLGPDALAKPVTHPERGTMTVQTIVETMAGHDLNHRAQIETVAGQAGAASAS